MNDSLHSLLEMNLPAVSSSKKKKEEDEEGSAPPFLLGIIDPKLPLTLRRGIQAYLTVRTVR